MSGQQIPTARDDIIRRLNERAKWLEVAYANGQCNFGTTVTLPESTSRALLSGSGDFRQDTVIRITLPPIYAPVQCPQVPIPIERHHDLPRTEEESKKRSRSSLANE